VFLSTAKSNLKKKLREQSWRIRGLNRFFQELGERRVGGPNSVYT
jgi:hypothetical protein